MRPLPSPNAAVLNQDSVFTSIWYRFFAQFVSKPPAPDAQTLGGSPFSYTASSNGWLVVKGGTVSKIEVTRGQDVIDMGVTAGPIPLAVGDVCAVTYTVAPTVTFMEG